jgi:hypothetical protein
MSDLSELPSNEVPSVKALPSKVPNGGLPALFFGESGEPVAASQFAYPGGKPDPLREWVEDELERLGLPLGSVAEAWAVIESYTEEKCVTARMATIGELIAKPEGAPLRKLFLGEGMSRTTRWRRSKRLKHSETNPHIGRE